MQSCTSSSGGWGQIAAFVASPEVFLDTSWLVEFGASSHCTSSLENLQYKIDYTGQDQLFVGNSIGIPSSSIGKTYFKTDSYSFFLKYVLYTPSIT